MILIYAIYLVDTDVEIKLTRAKIIFMLCRQSPHEFSETVPLASAISSLYHLSHLTLTKPINMIASSPLTQLAF